MSKSKRTHKTLSSNEAKVLLSILEARFKKYDKRHSKVEWTHVSERLKQDAQKLWSLNEMEASGGEPDVVTLADDGDTIYFYDCVDESPKGRRSLCYDGSAWNSRKQDKPKGNALDVAEEMGIELLSEEQYASLQAVVPMDRKSSSWLRTPEDVRALGGALFGDCRYGRVFTYHNGAESYYAARGFRGRIGL